jgi:hypothetical protein
MTLWCRTCGHIWEASGPAETIVWPRCALDDLPHPPPPTQAPEGRELPPAKVTEQSG